MKCGAAKQDDKGALELDDPEMKKFLVTIKETMKMLGIDGHNVVAADECWRCLQRLWI